MWAMKDGYDFIVVNFGFWEYCKSHAEAKEAAAKMKGDKPTIYQRGFFSANLNKHVGLDKWFPLEV